MFLLVAYGSSQSRDRIQATAANLCHSHSNTGSESCLRPTPQLRATLDTLTHRARPRIEPVSSWMLVRFISTEPQQELQEYTLNNFTYIWNILNTYLQSRRKIPPAWFLFFRIALAILGLLWFHMNFWIVCSTSVKNVVGNLIGIALNL